MYSRAGLKLLVMALFNVGAPMARCALAAPPADACALLTRSEVAAAVGGPVTAGSHIAPSFTKTCTWNAAGSNGGTVTLMLEGIAQYHGGERMAQIRSVSVTSVSGIGDGAYYLAVGGNVGLIVRKGNTAFKITVYAHAPIERKRAMEETLAKRVLPKL